MQIKLNYRDPSWWGVLASFIVSGAVLIGVLDNNNKDAALFGAQQVVQGLSVLVVQSGVVWNYFRQKRKAQEEVLNSKNKKRKYVSRKGKTHNLSISEQQQYDTEQFLENLENQK